MVSSESTAQKKKITEVLCVVFEPRNSGSVADTQSIKPLPQFWRGGMLTVFKDMVMLVFYGGYTEKVIKDLLGDR